MIREYLDQTILVDEDEDLAPLGYIEMTFAPARIDLSPIAADMLCWDTSSGTPFKATQLLRVPVVERSRRLQKLRSAIAVGKDGGILSVIVAHPGGKRRQLRLAYRIKRTNGRVVSMRAVLIDDTETRRREAELRATLSTVPSAMIVIDAQGIIRSFSATAERMFGHSAEFATGKRIDLLMPDPYRSEHSSYLERYVNT
ncbi:MAG: PAS domain S-box protein, partial [Sphingorhabdus sp.]